MSYRAAISWPVNAEARVGDCSGPLQPWHHAGLCQVHWGNVHIHVYNRYAVRIDSLPCMISITYLSAE